MFITPFLANRPSRDQNSFRNRPLVSVRRAIMGQASLHFVGLARPSAPRAPSLPGNSILRYPLGLHQGPVPVDISKDLPKALTAVCLLHRSSFTDHPSQIILHKSGASTYRGTPPGLRKPHTLATVTNMPKRLFLRIRILPPGQLCISASAYYCYLRFPWVSFLFFQFTH